MDEHNKPESAKQPVKQPASYRAVTRRLRPAAGKYVTAIILLLIACFTAGLGGGYVSSHLSSVTTSLDRNAATDGNAVVSANEADISAVATKVGPSVVSIDTTGSTQSLFGSQQVEGAGSGIIISSDGYILTNKHVVSGSSQMTVTTSDGTVYDSAKVVGTDPLNDLAFVKIDGVNNLTPAVLGDSSSVRIGENVVAIGNSLGQFQNTVTSGIISGTGRPITASEQGGNSSSGSETLTDLIQTDAAINPGNSGGPLTNLSGQVIGIDTAVAQNAQSIGFAIPINSAKGIIKNLLKDGKVERAYLGINYQTITPALAKQYNLSVKEGAYVSSTDNSSAVISGSPADKAGIKDKDIITKVGDLTVGEQGSVSSLVSEYGVGDTVALTVLRGSQTLTINVTLQQYTGSSQ